MSVSLLLLQQTSPEDSLWIISHPLLNCLLANQATYYRVHCHVCSCSDWMSVTANHDSTALQVTSNQARPDQIMYDIQFQGRQAPSRFGRLQSIRPSDAVLHEIIWCLTCLPIGHRAQDTPSILVSWASWALSEAQIPATGGLKVNGLYWRYRRSQG